MALGFLFANLAHFHIQAKSQVGTAQYIAPEVLKGEGYDETVDWWSLGCILYELFTGVTPFMHTTYEETLENMSRREELLYNPTYPDESGEEVSVIPDSAWNLIGR